MTTAQFPEQPAPVFARCRCDWLGKGTPEHEVSALCRSLRPDGPRDHMIADDRGSDGDTTDWPIADSAGYLACGCHGSQRDHTCEPAEAREWDQ